MIRKFLPEGMFDLSEIVKATGYNVQTFRRWIHKGKVRGVKVGKHYLIAGAELNRVFGIK